MDKLPEGSRVVIYARNSAVGQKFSVEDQLAVLKPEIENNGWVLVNTYIDNDRSGASVEERPEFQRILKDAERGGFQYVVVYDISRFSRGGVVEFWPFIRELRQRKVQLYNHARQQIINNRNALVATVDAAQAAEENLKRSKDCVRTSLLNVTQRGIDPGRQAPYGFDQLRTVIATNVPYERYRYMHDGGKLVMDPEGKEIRRIFQPKQPVPVDETLRTSLVPSTPERVEVARRIFRLAKTHGGTRIADELNREGIPGPRGPSWSANTIYDMIQNPAYRGARAYGRTRKSRYHHVKAGKVQEYEEVEMGQLHHGRVPVEEWVVQENAHEPLVAAAEWHEVQEARKGRQKFTARNRRGKNQRREYLLTGFLNCACEGRLHGQTVMTKGRSYSRYNCGARSRKGSAACAAYSLPAGPLEDFVMDSMRPALTNAACMDALRAGIQDEVKRQMTLFQPANGDDEAKLKKERVDVEQAVDALTNSLVGDKATMDAITPKLKRWAARLNEIDRALQRMRPAPDKAEIERLVNEGMAFYVERVIGTLRTAMDAGNLEVVAAEGQGPSEGKGGGPERRGERACVAEMKGLFRLLETRLDYDPKRKEGTLEFSPFR